MPYTHMLLKNITGFVYILQELLKRKSILLNYQVITANHFSRNYT